MTENLGSKQVLKSLSQTKWSARAHAVSALHDGHKQITQVLISIAEDTEQPRATRDEALEFILLIEIWSSILERIDKTSHQEEEG